MAQTITLQPFWPIGTEVQVYNGRQKVSGIEKPIGEPLFTTTVTDEWGYLELSGPWKPPGPQVGFGPRYAAYCPSEDRCVMFSVGR